VIVFFKTFNKAKVKGMHDPEARKANDAVSISIPGWGKKKIKKGERDKTTVKYRIPEKSVFSRKKKRTCQSRREQVPRDWEKESK